MIVDGMEKCSNFSTADILKQKYPFLSHSMGNDFIGVFDGIFSKQYCDRWIKHFDEAEKNGLTYNRLQGMQRDSHINADDSIDYANATFYHDHGMSLECREFNSAFWEVVYKLYAEKYSILKTSDQHKIYTVKIQRTKPQEGYHIWHCEDSTRLTRNRLLTFIMYLNDIEDGGETEFLYLSKRVKPVAGRVVLWPAGFTHTHRGNPPLSQSKYIITGWVEF
jgi:hypothetical protein